MKKKKESKKKSNSGKKAKAAVPASLVEAAAAASLAKMEIQLNDAEIHWIRYLEIKAQSLMKDVELAQFRQRDLSQEYNKKLMEQKLKERTARSGIENARQERIEYLANLERKYGIELRHYSIREDGRMFRNPEAPDPSEDQPAREASPLKMDDKLSAMEQAKKEEILKARRAQPPAPRSVDQVLRDKDGSPA